MLKNVNIEDGVESLISCIMLEFRVCAFTKNSDHISRNH
jgi:hypothetical protein